MKLLFLVAAIVILFSGCQKLLDYYNLNGGSKPPPNCRILSKTDTTNPDVERTIYYYFNDGRPMNISFPYPEEGHSISFEYDSKKRLIYELPSTYVGNPKKYVYKDESDLPVRDTVYRWYGLVYVETLQYDDFGRIVSEDSRFVSAPDDYDDEAFGDRHTWEGTTTYFYDIRGNRQISPLGQANEKPIIYSDKPNLYSLNPIWQLIYRDFSKNSVLTNDVKQYNENGLPLRFTNSPYVYAYDCAN